MRGLLRNLMACFFVTAMLVSLIAGISVSAVEVSEDTVWDFAKYSQNAIAAQDQMTEDYNGLDIHLNAGDEITDAGLVWTAPGTITSDSKSVANNRYIVFTPVQSGTVTVKFSGSRYDSASKAPRMYIVSGDSASCMSKTNSDANGKAATVSGANKEAALTAEVEGGKDYYIWPYYYNNSSVSFTVSGISYSAAVPEMKTRNIYESNMLLQRDEPIYIDGTCSAAVEAATVSLVNESTNETVRTAEAVISGREWNATLDAVSDYENVYSVIISSEGMEDIVYTNVIFGDQYIFSGQSNMWMKVSDYASIDKDAYSSAAAAPHLTDKIRLMYTPGQSDYGTNVLQFDAQNKKPWRDFSTYSNVKEVGAPAFTAAVKLYEETGVPIGVIDNPYPGSYISSWFDSALNIDACNTGRNKTSNERNWYCGRIYPLRNLKLSGIFWYQGEADAATTYHGNPYEYYSEKLPELISAWRELFNDSDLPFYYTQLSRIGSTIVDENNPDTGSAGKMPIKRAQTDVYLNMADKRNIGVISTLDLYGNHNASGSRNCRTDIHLAQKQYVGDRMANLALADIYGKAEDKNGNKIYRMGPLYKSSKRVGSSVVVTFDTNGALSIMPSKQYTDTIGEQKIADGEFDPSVLNEFEVAGEDGVWHSANAEITADNEVTVTSGAVAVPVMVRYCGSDYPESPNLTDESGLPSYVFEKAVDKEENITPEPTEEPLFPVTVSYDADTRTLTLTSSDKGLTEAVIIKAQYENDALKTVKGQNVTFNGGAEDIENYDIGEDDKIFVWDSLGGMKPLSEVFTLALAPTAAPYASPTQNPDDIESTKIYVFGTDAAGDDEIAVNEATAYGDHNGETYGLIDIDEASVIDDIKFDGFSDDIITYPVSKTTNGITSVTASYDNYDADALAAFGDGVIPIRFAAAAEDAYYTVTATIINTGDSETEASLFMENRDVILYNHKLAAGKSITKSWNVNLLGQYYNSTGAYQDTAINVAAAGKDIGLSRVEIRKHKTVGKTVWLCTDSTGDNSSAHLPYFGLRGKCGVGQMLTKYFNNELAVNNQGEGGLTSGDTAHLNNFKDKIKAGDYLYVQYGFNGETASSLTKNLPRYYSAAHSKGAKLIVVSTTERQNSSFWSSGAWAASNSGIAEAGKAYVESMISDGADDIAFVDLNTAMNVWMNEETQRIFNTRSSLGFGDTSASRLAMNYYFGYDRDSGTDSVHINDAGADNAAYLIMKEIEKTVANQGVQGAVLAELANNKSSETAYAVSDEIIAKGWVPNDAYPYPLPSDVTYEYPTIVKSVNIENSAVWDITVMVQGNMQYYAIGAIDIMDGDSVVKTVYSKSTDINPLIDHIDNTACSYGDVYTMYFDAEETALSEGQTVRAYTVALPSGGEVTDEAYSSYSTPDEVDTVLLSAGFADGVDGFSEGGSAVKETSKTIKDGKTALKLTENGTGTYNAYKRFINNAEVSNGIVKLHFMINYAYGSFTIKLTPDTKTGSYVSGMKTLNVKDGTLEFEDGTEIGRIKSNKWTDIECVYNLIDGTESVSIAGGTPISVKISKLQSDIADDVSSILPLRGFVLSYMATGSTIPAYSFETYLTDIEVTAIRTGLPKYTVAAQAWDGMEEMGTVTGSGEYDINSIVSVSAKAKDGYEFTGWYDKDGNELSRKSEYSVRVRNDVSVYAKFEASANDPNVTKWRFGEFSSEASISGKADTEYTKNNQTLIIHTNSSDTVTEEGLYWSAPGGTKSDSTTTVTNNRYIEFTPEKSGTISITYSGTQSGKNYPRLYISCGDSLACTTKDANSAQLEANKLFDNKAGNNQYDTMTASLTAGKHYYIWAYYYSQASAKFTISDIVYDTTE